MLWVSSRSAAQGLICDISIQFTSFLSLIIHEKCQDQQQKNQIPALNGAQVAPGKHESALAMQMLPTSSLPYKNAERNLSRRAKISRIPFDQKWYAKWLLREQ